MELNETRLNVKLNFCHEAKYRFFRWQIFADRIRLGDSQAERSIGHLTRLYFKTHFVNEG